MTTKDLLEITGISEATLRRWLREGHVILELADAPRDWRGWRLWDQRHVDAILRYKERRSREHGYGSPNQLPLFSGRKREVT